MFFYYKNLARLIHRQLSYYLIYGLLLLYDFMFFLHFHFDLVTEKSYEESSNAVESANLKPNTETEFISDKFGATSERDLVEVQASMTKLGMTNDEKKTATVGERQESVMMPII